jgi:hypothetical protein
MPNNPNTTKMAEGNPRCDTLTYFDLEAMRRTGSGVFRRRVAQLSQSSNSSGGVLSETHMLSAGDATHRQCPSDPYSNQCLTREDRTKPEVMVLATPHALNPSRSLKRKKSQPSTSQAADRIKSKHASKPSIVSSSAYSFSSSQVPAPLAWLPPTELETHPPFSSSGKGKSSTPRHLSHHRYDTRLASAQNSYDKLGPTSEEPVFRGPLAVAEYERMKKEIESLKESLHEMKRSSKRQAKVYWCFIFRIFDRINIICLETRGNQGRVNGSNPGTFPFHGLGWIFFLKYILSQGRERK